MTLTTRSPGLCRFIGLTCFFACPALDFTVILSAPFPYTNPSPRTRRETVFVMKSSATLTMLFSMLMAVDSG